MSLHSDRKKLTLFPSGEFRVIFLSSHIMGYHVTGVISTALYLLSVLGLWIQLRKIWDRKSDPRLAERGEGVTAIISLNFITTAFLAFFVNFTYGFSLERFNHYLVWPRLVAILLTLTILYELKSDRKDRTSKGTFFVCCAMTLTALAILIFNRELAMRLAVVSQFLILLVTVLLAQGNAHQILMILRSGSTGGVALRSHQLTFLKDMGAVCFGLAMGLTGWPIVVLCSTNAFSKLVIVYLFRWVRISPIAAQQRNKQIPQYMG